MNNTVKKVTVGKNEAGMFEYQDTKKSIEMGETAFTLVKEDVMTGETKTLYFTEQAAAELFRDGFGITEFLS